MKGQITACGFVTGNAIDFSDSLKTSERPDYRLRFCYLELLIMLLVVRIVKGQITACGFVTFMRREL